MPQIEHIMPNFVQIIIDGKTGSRYCMWFSYKTLVAFAVNGLRVVRVNDWGTTTGKHLNRIDGGVKENRVPSSEFEEKYKEMVTDRLA